MTIEPAEARDLAAQWRVDGGAWHVSGETVCELSVGEHTVSFKRLDRIASLGRFMSRIWADPYSIFCGCGGTGCFGPCGALAKPDDIVVVIRENQSTYVTGNYTQSKDSDSEKESSNAGGDILVMSSVITALVIRRRSRRSNKET